MEAAQQYAKEHPYIQVPIGNFRRVQIIGSPTSRYLGVEYLYTPFFDRPAIRVRLVHRVGNRIFLQKYDDHTIFMDDNFAYYWQLIPDVPAAAAAPAAINAPINAEGRTQLFVAARDGNIVEVNRLLEAGANVNKAKNTGATPLHIASQNGHIPIVERLLAAPGIDVNKAMNDGATSLYIASQNGHIPIVERLLAAPGIDVNKAKTDGATSLLIASQNGHIPIVERLLAAPGIDVNKAKTNGATLLYIASQNGHLPIVERLLAVPGIDVNKAMNNGATPLFVASQNGHIPIVERLLAAPGIDVNKTMNDGITPLFVASENGHVAVVERLLAAPGIDLNKGNGIPLYVASYKGYLPIVERLLAVPGIDVNKAMSRGTTSLFTASQRAHLEIVERLLAVPGIDVNKAMNDGATPLLIASQKGHIPIVERLLAAPGIDVNKAMNNGATPLFIVSQNGHLPIVEHLLAVPGIDVNKAMNNGGTPLFVASQNGHIPIVERLLAVPGIDVMKRFNGKTALDTAREKGHAEIVRLLEEAMPKWRGFSRSDISLLNSIFETEPAPGQARSDAENVSCCPVCFKIVPVGRAAPQTVSRATGCMYMLDHNCSTLGGYYHRGLYDKYKNAHGNICWCTICGRICQQTPHRHYALGLAQGPKSSTIEAYDHSADPFGGEVDCIKYGGGGLKEKLMRYRRMREYALQLQDDIGKISFGDAIDQLIEETWNAPMVRHRKLEAIAREKKWNIPNTEFKELRNNNAAVAATAAPPVPYPFVGRPAMVPILGGEGMNNVSMANTPILIQLVHRRADGTVRPHEQRISIQTLFDALDRQFGGAGSPHFGICMFDDGCNGIHYPDELQNILNNYPREHLPDVERARYQSMVDVYRTRFNEAYRDIAAFKTQIDANIAAGAAMPAGGAGAGAGQGGGRYTIRCKKRSHRRSRSIKK